MFVGVLVVLGVLVGVFVFDADAIKISVFVGVFETADVREIDGVFDGVIDIDTVGSAVFEEV